MKNLPMILLAGGAAIVGISFFAQKDKADKADKAVKQLDWRKKIWATEIPVKNPDGLNVEMVRIRSVSPIY